MEDTHHFEDTKHRAKTPRRLARPYFLPANRLSRAGESGHKCSKVPSTTMLYTLIVYTKCAKSDLVRTCYGRGPRRQRSPSYILYTLYCRP